MFKKSHKNFAIRPSNLILWLNLNKINEIGILQSALLQVNPSFHFHAPSRYPCIQTASAVPKYFPVCSSFVLVIASDMHLEPGSEKRAKNVDFHTAKRYPDTTNTFSLFLEEFCQTDLRPIYCSPTSLASEDVVG